MIVARKNDWKGSFTNLILSRLVMKLLLLHLIAAARVIAGGAIAQLFGQK